MDTAIVNEILTTLGLDGLPPEDGMEIIDRIGILAMDEILAQAIDALPESAQDAYLQLLDTNPEPDALMEFFDANIPNFADIVQTAVQQIAQNFKEE